MRKILADIALWFICNAKYTDERTKSKVLTEAVKHLFNTISVEDLLKENPDGTLRFENRVLTPAHKKDLQEQAKILEDLLLWRVLKKDLQYQLNKKMYLESEITADVMWGKLLLYMWEVIETRVKNLRK